MRNTIKEAREYIMHLRTLANRNPTGWQDALLHRDHKLTTDQQNLLELLSAAKVVVGHLDAVAVPTDMREAGDRLREAINLCDIAPRKKGEHDD